MTWLQPLKARQQPRSACSRHVCMQPQKTTTAAATNAPIHSIQIQSHAWFLLEDVLANDRIRNHDHFCSAPAAVRSTPDAQRRLEVVVGDGHGIEDLGVDVLVLQVDDIHLLADALQRGFRAECSQIRTHKTVSVLQICRESALLVVAITFHVAPEFAFLTQHIPCLKCKSVSGVPWTVQISSETCCP